MPQTPDGAELLGRDRVRLRVAEIVYGSGHGAQARIARALGVRPETIYRALSRRMVSDRMLDRIAEQCGYRVRRAYWIEHVGKQ